MGMDIIGDPTIRMVGNYEVKIETIGLPSGTIEDVVYITHPDGSISYGDLVDGTYHGYVAHGSIVKVMPLFIGIGYTPLDPYEFVIVRTPPGPDPLPEAVPGAHRVPRSALDRTSKHG